MFNICVQKLQLIDTHIKDWNDLIKIRLHVPDLANLKKWPLILSVVRIAVL